MAIFMAYSVVQLHKFEVEELSVSTQGLPF
jgi:hypothetical protein